jgi:hypothetical protein
MPFPRLQVGRKTPVLRPTCDLQFMRWNRTIYFSRHFSWHRNARSELEMLPPSPNLLLFFATLLPPPHRICPRDWNLMPYSSLVITGGQKHTHTLYHCRCRLLTFPAAVVTPRQHRQSSGGSAAAVWQRWAVRRWCQQRVGNGGSAVAALEAVAAASSRAAAAAVAERQRQRQHGDGGGRAAAG